MHFPERNMFSSSCAGTFMSMHMVKFIPLTKGPGVTYKMSSGENVLFHFS
jgi:hypothetical protein